ncbi:membrane protein [Shewanella sairae]|uniref:Membrane protein n=1 Tax=Shewanella sairae TaxID=190310 RepID=A0ABQ4PRK5_9GAMM|nr:DUF417 family protein [Shewanella sairae]MCL1132558.1 YkgB family protein [Shewanella sairae]GIU52254.1 membrane protein [Shewanella sairae]
MKPFSVSYVFAVVGISVFLLWLGIYKFTLTEAKLIEPLIVNHPLIGWVYQWVSVQMVSSIIGTIEIIVAIALLIGLKNQAIGFISGIAAMGIFIVTLSFIVTTPDTWKMSDGILVTNFFLLKDWVFLAVAMMVVETNREIMVNCSVIKIKN